METNLPTELLLLDMIDPLGPWNGCRAVEMLTGKGGRSLAAGEGEQDEQGFGVFATAIMALSGLRDGLACPLVPP